MASFSRLQFVFLFFLVASMSTIQVSLAGGEGSLTKDQCPAACAKRCSATSHLNNCLMFCNLCCDKCLCIISCKRAKVEGKNEFLECLTAGKWPAIYGLEQNRLDQQPTPAPDTVRLGSVGWTAVAAHARVCGGLG
ncbi:hypothetical protein HYC85_007490 [Camellia sinensis]|uniref:Uncharacterized protein n=1 Tax=Camellia sinensis TaxID=4442 RepID=A0A7J7HRI8_CAMSI|nr:hypothetical protein HYC85_007490 [Camellia sinensis]